MENPNNWTATITLNFHPHCPICGDPLTQTGWANACGVAICIGCRTGDAPGFAATIMRITYHPNHRLLRRRNGITWYDPATLIAPWSLPCAPQLQRYLDHPDELQANARRAERD